MGVVSKKKVITIKMLSKLRMVRGKRKVTKCKSGRTSSRGERPRW